MMGFAQRVQDAPASASLAPLVDQAKERGIVVHNLHMGQPDIPTPEVFYQAIAAHTPPVLGYGGATGVPAYLDALVTLYKSLGVTVTPEQCLPTFGASEAIEIAFFCLLNPGDEVLIPEPFFSHYQHFATMVGAVVRPIPTLAEEGFALPDLATLTTYVTPKTKGILLTNPGNPTGHVLTRGEIETISQLANEADLWVICNEMYRSFTYSKPSTLAQIPDLKQRLVILDSLSKQFSICGARVGHIYSANDGFMEQAKKVCAGRLCTSQLGQVGAVALYELGQKGYFEQVRQTFVERREKIIKGLAAIPGVLCLQPEGSFYVMAQLPVDDTLSLQKFMLQSFDYKGHTLLFTPGVDFYATPGKGNQQIRLAWVEAASDLDFAMEILAKAIAAYHRR